MITAEHLPALTAAALVLAVLGITVERVIHYRRNYSLAFTPKWSVYVEAGLVHVLDRESGELTKFVEERGGLIIAAVRAARAMQASGERLGAPIRWEDRLDRCIRQFVPVGPAS